MSFDLRRLRGRIVEKYGSLEKFAKAFGVSNVSMSRKMNGLVRFSADDIVKICTLLEIPKEEIGAYFFEPRV